MWTLGHEFNKQQRNKQQVTVITVIVGLSVLKQYNQDLPYNLTKCNLSEL